MQAQLPSTIPTYVREKIATAIVPVAYTEALNALAKCQTIDEGKYWSDKADALAAWAKIYKSNEAEVQAKRLKAHAFRRMSKLADEIAPKGGWQDGELKKGPYSTLLNHGLSRVQATKARLLGALPQETFDRELSKPRPPGINSLSKLAIGINKGASNGRAISSEAWRIFAGNHANNAVSFRTFCRKNSAYEIGRNLTADEALVARSYIKEFREWLDELEISLTQETN